MIFQVILITLSFLLLAAHFFRAWHPLLTLICIGAPFLLFIKKRWVRILLQTLTYLGALVWIRTCILIVRERWIHGMRYRGVIVILGIVTIFTIVSGILLNMKKVRERYR